jgi:DNA-binding NtrC family response regulator
MVADPSPGTPPNPWRRRYVALVPPVNPRHGATVLVVDDDAAWRAVLERWLQDEGMRGIGVARGEWVTGAIHTHQPDVVLLDVHLPGIDGLYVLGVVRRHWPTLPVIIMTAFGGRETAELARRCGATGYLDKPFRMTELASELARATGGRDAEANADAQ